MEIILHLSLYYDEVSGEFDSFCIILLTINLMRTPVPQ